VPEFRNPELETLLHALAPIVRPAMLETYQSNCCVATCKILLRVFAQYGYKARPVAVAVGVYNREMVKLMDAGVAFPEDKEERLALFNRTGAWGVGIMAGDHAEPNSFGGHLILNVNGLLVDGSLQQAERPQYQMPLPPLLWCRPEPGFFAERVKRQRSRGNVVMDGHTMLVVYQRIANDGFRQGRDWSDTPHSIDTYLKILSRLSKRLYHRTAKETPDDR
jgi:hypothetical protein